MGIALATGHFETSRCSGRKASARIRSEQRWRRTPMVPLEGPAVRPYTIPSTRRQGGVTLPATVSISIRSASGQMGLTVFAPVAIPTPIGKAIHWWFVCINQHIFTRRRDEIHNCWIALKRFVLRLRVATRTAMPEQPLLAQLDRAPGSNPEVWGSILGAGHRRRGQAFACIV